MQNQLKISDQGFSDKLAVCDNHPSLLRLLESSKHKQLFKSRNQQRDFFRSAGFEQPEGIFSSDFAKLSAWAVQRNRFPIILKTDLNQHDCINSYILKAFRELPIFHDEIADFSPYILEAFWPAKAFIEATFIGNRLTLISQIGFARSMRRQQSWRVFPIQPPKNCLKTILFVRSLLPEEASLSETPLRISFAFNPDQTIPLSINLGFNRHEYFEEWGNFLAEPQCPEKKSIIFNKILFYKINPGLLEESELSDFLQMFACAKKMAIGETTAILLQSANPASLLDDSKKADAFFRRFFIRDEPQTQSDD